ncbi:MAG: tetratricopeptide repeat protein [Telluria sp.]
MHQFRLARISLILAALGLNIAPALLTTAHAQAKPDAAATAPKPDTVRPDLFKLLDPTVIKELMAAKKYAEVQEKLTKADAFADKTPYENYVIDRMRLALASSTNDDAMAIKALESVIASGRLPKTDQTDFIQALANYHYNAKNYPKTIEWLKRYQKESATPLKVRPTLIRAYYLSGDYASAKTELLPVIAEARQAGKAPELEDLRLLASSASKLKDNAAYVETMEQLVAFYPTDEFWTDLLNRMQSKPTFNIRLQLDAYRLENAALKAMAPEEYNEMAELALIAGFPTEAKKAMDAGFAAGVLGTGSNAAKHKQVRDKAAKGAADDAKNIAGGEAAAVKAKDGTGLVNLGYAYVTMDQFDKGIALMEKGIAKGGMKRPDEANLHLGVAYAKAGRKDDALKVFQGLKGDDGMTDLAKYWTLWLNRPVEAAAVAAPAK